MNRLIPCIARATRLLLILPRYVARAMATAYDKHIALLYGSDDE